MNYQAELNFVRELLKTYRLNIHLYDETVTPDTVLPAYNWVGDFLSQNTTLAELYLNLKKQCEPKVVYQIDDGFLCHHIVFLLSSENEEPIFAHIGPYTQEVIGKQQITKLSEKYRFSPELISKLESFYQEIPYVADETHLTSVIYTFCALIWGGTDKFTTKQFQDFYPINSDLLLKSTTGKDVPDTTQDMLYVEERYDVERQMMQAVSTGQIPKAELLFATLTKYQFEVRSTNALRNTKNYLIILNTLLRTAARNGDVPPFHIDKLSSAYAHKIESTTSTNSGMALMKEMVRKYCLLVKNHSMKGYSLLIRKVLTQIDYDLTADLGLKNLATQLNVNPSYLSTLFKKETGSTLTEYVNQKRVEHALFLLNSSSLQIQMIAQYSGIPDVNYFTKTFKKIIGITPKEYRDRISNPF